MQNYRSIILKFEHSLFFLLLCSMLLFSRIQSCHCYIIDDAILGLKDRS